jgi:hypothetical protein
MPAGIEWELTTEVSDIGKADFTIASGVFNTKLKANPAAWPQHIVARLIFSREPRCGASHLTCSPVTPIGTRCRNCHPYRSPLRFDPVAIVGTKQQASRRI